MASFSCPNCNTEKEIAGVHLTEESGRSRCFGCSCTLYWTSADGTRKITEVETQ